MDKELHRIVTTAIVYKDFSYLIAKRALHKIVKPGKWAVVGGGLLIDDYINTPPSTKESNQWYGAIEKALRREVKEETNLEIGKPEFLTDLTFIRPDGIPVLCLSYFAPYISGEVKIDGDHTEYAWVSAKEAESYDLIEGILGEIQEVDTILKKRNLS
ncbi:MAG: NUDIX domain-containing protein [Candidatus Zambryskibacteria bacterium]|nr:NUDIX domain-containing protein [Candidatus Zambryskibacteria bacterium]